MVSPQILMTSRRRRLTRQHSSVALLALLFIGACRSDVVGPTTTEFTLSRAHEPRGEGEVLLWNRTACNLVSQYQEVPRADRGYALLSVAQLKVLSALRDRRSTDAATAASASSAAVSRVERVAIADASSAVLAALFPSC
ncbi:MAG: hypothetical protein ACT4P6_10735 [Gemmatimonadaceae bacterium]